MHYIALRLVTTETHQNLEEIMAKTANLALRIEPAIKAGLEKAAAQDRRTVSNYVENLIVDDLEKKGIPIATTDRDE